jgi:hypothetical protein
VKAPVEAVVLPIGPGDANVAPLNDEALRFGTFVVLATTNGAVPVTNVDVIWPVALMVVNAPLDAVVLPIAPGEAKVAPLNDEAFKLGTFVVLVTTNGAVPIAIVEIS